VSATSADWLPYCLPLRRPWLTSHGSLVERHGSLLRLRSTDGLTGWGDCAPLPEFAIDDVAARALAEECALLDLAAQRAGLPLGSWLSGEPPQQSLAVNAVLGAISPSTVVAAQDAVVAGYRILKIKVGCAPVADEIMLLEDVYAALPAGIRLRLDANGAWSLADAETFLAACCNLPVDGIEEPLRDPDAETLRRLQSLVEFPLAIDESLHLVDHDFWQAPPVRRLVIKPARLGGLLSSVATGLRAQAAGVECIVTSSLESACGLTACAHLAAAIAPDACHGLATADWLAADTGTAPRISAGRLWLPQTPGLGFPGRAGA
jgi:o-succinylbenzoate synthase